jgi:hypothetical protein
LPFENESRVRAGVYEFSLIFDFFQIEDVPVSQKIEKYGVLSQGEDQVSRLPGMLRIMTFTVITENFPVVYN